MRKAVILAAVFCAVSAASAITWPWAGKTKNAVQAQQRTNKESDKHLFYASDEYGTITFDWDEENKGYFVHAKWLTNIMTTDFSIGFTALTYPRDIIFYSTDAKWLQDWMNKDDLYAALNGINTVQFFAGFCTYFDSPHGAFFTAFG